MMVGRAWIDGSVRYVRISDGLVTPLKIRGEVETGLLLESGELWEALIDGQPVPLASSRLAPPVTGTRKVVGIGLNYVDHANESGQDLGHDPVIFAKFPSSIIGPGEPITFRKDLTDGVDLEAELAVVMGKSARSVPYEEALSYVGAYTCLNDVSARDVQFADGQWVRGKSLDSFCPIGPWLVRAATFGLPGPQHIRSWIGGDLMQSAVLSDMVFGVADLIARLSRSFTLEPGDVIATGTPPGVGWFRTPRRVLQDGDIVTIGIDGIGELVNPVRAVG